MYKTRSRRARSTALRGGALALLLAGAPGGPAGADDDGHRHGHDHGHDHDRARAALAGGAIRPLHEVLAAVAAAAPGDVVAVELEQEDGRWLYEVKVIAADGRLRKLYVDAGTARLLHPGEED